MYADDTYLEVLNLIIVGLAHRGDAVVMVFVYFTFVRAPPL